MWCKLLIFSLSDESHLFALCNKLLWYEKPLLSWSVDNLKSFASFFSYFECPEDKLPRWWYTIMAGMVIQSAAPQAIGAYGVMRLINAKIGRKFQNYCAISRTISGKVNLKCGIFFWNIPLSLKIYQFHGWFVSYFPWPCFLQQIWIVLGRQIGFQWVCW